MNQETIKIPSGRSGSATFSKLIMTVRAITSSTVCDVVVGYPGLPNTSKAMSLGDAFLYETTQDGIIEIRLTAKPGLMAGEFLISQVSPKIGLSAALLSDDPYNSPFSATELVRITQGIADAQSRITQSGAFTESQLSLITVKLAEIEQAAERLGKKDWLNYVAGSLTGLFTAAAFAPHQAHTILSAIQNGLSWFFTSASALLVN
jgi:hypothetical protein